MRLIGRLEPAKEKNQSQQHKPTNCHRIRKYTVCAARIWLVRSLCLFKTRRYGSQARMRFQMALVSALKMARTRCAGFLLMKVSKKRYERRKLLPSGKQSRDKMDGRQWGWYICSWYYCNGCPGSAPCLLLEGIRQPTF